MRIDRERGARAAHTYTRRTHDRCHVEDIDNDDDENDDGECVWLCVLHIIRTRQLARAGQMV